MSTAANTKPEEPMFYSRQQLADRAGISLRTFSEHEKYNTGNLNAARVVEKGIGIVYKETLCRRYLALCAAAPSRRKCRRPGYVPAAGAPAAGAGGAGGGERVGVSGW